MPTGDNRTYEQIATETCDLICALQDAVGVLFPWSMYDCDKITLSNDTIKLLLKAIND
jgi:N12 class adenine-specific DNA methylase